MARTGHNTATRVPDPWRWLAAAAIVLPALLLFWQIVFSGRVLFWGVPLLQFGPWYQSVADAVKAGQWPLWNPLLGNGTPLLANYQSAVFYPPNWLHLLLSPARALSWSMLIHLWWAGLGVWFYGRVLGLRPFARLVGCLSFMLSGFLVSRLGFASIGSTYPWLPWIFWAAERMLQRPFLRSAVPLGVCLGMQWLAGHAQTSFHTGLALAAYVLWRLLQPAILRRRAITGRPSALWKSIGLVLISLLLGIGIAAIQLFPTAELQRLSQRSDGVEADFGMMYSLWPFRLIAFLAPRFFGHPATGDYWGYCCNYWEDNGYVGLLPLLLAGGAVIAWLKQRFWPPGPGEQGGPDRDLPAFSLTPFFALLALLSVVLALGVHTPIYPFLFRHAPGFRLFQAPARFLSLWTWGAAVLASLAAEQWRPTVRTGRIARYGTVVGLALILAAAGSSRLLVGRTVTFVDGVSQLGLSLVVIGLLTQVQPRPAATRHVVLWSAAALVVVAADLVLAAWGANPTVEPWLFTRGTESAEALRAAGLTGRIFHPAADEYDITFRRYLDVADFGTRETATWFGLRETLLPDTGVLDGIASAGNFDPLLPERHARLVEAVNRADREDQLRLLRMMGVQILATRQTRVDLKRVYGNADVAFYQVPDPLPRAYVVNSALSASDAQEAMRIIADPTFDPAKAVVVEAMAGSSPSSDRWETVVPAQLTDTRNSVKIHASLPAEGYLVLLDTCFPGWQARIDGEPADIHCANVAFRAVKVPAGEHDVEFTYRPASFRVGAAVTGGAWLISFALLFLGGVSRRRETR